MWDNYGSVQKKINNFRLRGSCGPLALTIWDYKLLKIFAIVFCQQEG